MPIKADTRYTGTIGHGSHSFESERGTPGFQVMLECEDGNTDFMIWLTEKNRERALKAFETIGADLARLGDPNYIEFELGTAIVGREVSFGTAEEEYKGKKSVKVKWIGPKSAGTPIKTMANFFSKSAVAGVVSRVNSKTPAPDWVNTPPAATQEPEPVPPQREELEDDVVPF